MPDDDALDEIARVVRAISDLCVQQQRFIGLDFADLESVLARPQDAAGERRAFVGHGEASGENRATVAAENAIAALRTHIASRGGPHEP